MGRPKKIIIGTEGIEKKKESQPVFTKEKIKAMPEAEIYRRISIIMDEEADKKDINKATMELIDQFAPLMAKQINKYKNSRKDLRDYDDLDHAATLALIKAIQQFDTTAGTKFITYLYNGLHNELITTFRKMVKQSNIEAVNASSYFYKNESSIDTPAEYCSNKEEIDMENSDATLLFINDIINNVDLTVAESLYFFMFHGLCCNKYSHKDIRQYFGLNKIHLYNAQLKVFSYLFDDCSEESEKSYRKLFTAPE